MPVFHSGHFRVFWHVLMDAADRFDHATDDKEIIIISPWISDVTTSRSGWSDASVASAFNIDTGNIESLSDILGELVIRGYDVKVVTLSTIGKWLPKARNENLDRERNFMEKIRDKGVTCLLRNNLHMKYVKTPFAVFAGSINISFNGLSGQTQEAADLFFEHSHEQDFRQRKDGIENTLVGAKDYFSARIPITTWTPPDFSSGSGDASLLDSNYWETKIGVLYDELGEKYLPMVADGFLPPGRIIGGAETPEEILSVQAQFGTLLMRITMLAVELLRDETVTGCDEKSLWVRLYGTEEVNEDSDAPERLPEIQVIRQMLLPAVDQGIAGHLKSRLGFIGNDPNWALWRDKVTELLNGVEFLSAELAGEPTAIDEENVILLNKMTKHFEDLN